MPNEILLLIFHQMPAIRDAVNLAHSCSHLYNLFSAPKNKIDILCSAADAPQNLNHSLDKAFSGKHGPLLVVKVAKKGVSVLIRQPPSNWLLQSAHSSKYLLIEVEDEEILDASVSTLRDFTTIQRLPNNTESSFLEIFDAFLAQFHDLDTMLNGYYEHITTELISGAARLQSQLLCELDADTGTDMDLSGDTTVIALALHCFAMTHFMEGVDGYNPDIPETELFRDGSPVVVMEQADDEKRFLPTIRVHKPEYHPVPGLDSELSNQSTGESGLCLDREFHRMLEHVMHVSFRLLNTQDPRHWPTVLYVLMIFSVGVRDALHPFLRWRQKLGDAKRESDLVFRDLARYYYICTGGGQILSDRWCKKEYAARVQQDRVAVEHAEMLNRVWLDLGMLDLLNLLCFSDLPR
jgi:hypothetical protein